MKRKLFKLESMLKGLLVVLSFIFLFPTFGFVVYWMFIHFSVYKSIAGCAFMWMLIHVNKSM